MVKSNGQFELTATENLDFIHSFFQPEKRENESKLLNISAIVGENGAGKSITLSFLKKILGNDFNGGLFRPYFILVTKDIKGGYRYSGNMDFSCKLGWVKSSKRSATDSDTIFYTPIFNPTWKLNPDLSTDIIDVSTETMIKRDWDEYNPAAKDIKYQDEPLYPFIVRNTQRHSEILSRVPYEQLFGSKTIDVAKGVFIEVQEIGKNLSDYENLSYETKQALKKLRELWGAERIRDQRGKTNAPYKKEDRKKFLKRDVRFRIVLATFYHINHTNLFLEEIHVPTLTSINKANTFDQAFESFLDTIFEIDKTHKKKTKTYTSTHSRLREIVMPLIEEYEVALESLSNDRIPIDVVNDSTIDVRFEDHVKILHQYRIFQSELFQLNNHSPEEFVVFESNKGLSAGEKAYLDLYSRLNTAFDIFSRKAKSGAYGENPLTLYLLIDEGEIGFHLRWQKEYVKDLCKMAPLIFNTDIKELSLQIIFTTHSPISLSDLPCSHVTYLTKEVEGGEIKAFTDPHRLTFGANIQNLLSDSFFMDDGTIGEFAKDKIESLIDYLKSEADSRYWSQQVADRVISQIGDDILQERLRDLYSNRFHTRLSLDEEEQKLQERLKEIQDLRNRLK